MPVISQIDVHKNENPGGRILQEGGNVTSYSKRLEFLE